MGMKWFFHLFAAASAVLGLSFIAWVVTRALLAEAANRVVGQIMIGDLCAVTVMLAYSSFVGSWNLWEGLTRRGSARAAMKLAAVKPGSAPYSSQAPNADSA